MTLLRRCLIAAAAAALLAGCAPSRLVEAERVLRDIQAGDGPSRLKETTPAPRRESISFTIDGAMREADLYRPGDSALAALVVMPGVSPQGRDDPLLVAFARTLARARFQVLVPEVANLRQLRVGQDDWRIVVDALRWLAQAQETGPRPGDGARPIGLVAISYALGPAVLAAADPRAAGTLGLVLGIGGYFDIESVVTFFTTGWFRDAETSAWRRTTPNPFGKWVFLESNAGRMTDPSDKALLSVIAKRRLDDPQAPIDDLARRLLPDGKAVLALVENTDRAAVRPLMARLPAEIRAEMQAMTLKGRDLSGLTAELLLVHGRNDPVIPSGESVALAAAVAPGQAAVYLIDGLSHVEVGGKQGVGFFSALQMVEAVYRMLAARDRWAER